MSLPRARQQADQFFTQKGLEIRIKGERYDLPSTKTLGGCIDISIYRGEEGSYIADNYAVDAPAIWELYREIDPDHYFSGMVAVSYSLPRIVGQDCATQYRFDSYSEASTQQAINQIWGRFEAYGKPWIESCDGYEELYQRSRVKQNPLRFCVEPILLHLMGRDGEIASLLDSKWYAEDSKYRKVFNWFRIEL
ncbi:MAG: hypothetical protein H7Y17_10760 [Chlorobia bacterium]|nr:hypothetical protein [Fimbriimonadaceae bacterium]